MTTTSTNNGPYVEKTPWGWIAENPLTGEYSDVCRTKREALVCAEAMRSGS